MPAKLLFQYAHLNFDNILMDRVAIRKYIAQRGEVEQLDRVIWINKERSCGAGIRQVRNNEWWVNGHFPGNPILPGVLVVETAAQFSSIIYQYKMEMIKDATPKILAFSGIEKTRFRLTVSPGDELLYLIKEIRFSNRCIIADVQALKDFRNNSPGKMVYQGRIVGMPVTNLHPNMKKTDEALVVVQQNGLTKAEKWV